MTAWKKDRRRIAIRAVRKTRCWVEQEFGTLRWYHRGWYTLKAALCITLTRERATDWCQELVIVADWNHRHDVDGYPCWVELAVGRGIFRGWYYMIYSNGA